MKGKRRDRPQFASMVGNTADVKSTFGGVTKTDNGGREEVGSRILKLQMDQRNDS